MEQNIIELRKKRGRPCKNEVAINLKTNNEYMKKYNNLYYHNKVKKIIQPILCECGKSIAEKYKSTHQLTAYHLRHLGEIQI